MSKARIPKTTLDQETERDHGRRPYYHGRETKDLTFTEYLRGGEGANSYREMIFRRPMRKTLEPHSEFKKPYMSDEFPEMEYYWDLKLPDPPPTPEIPGTTTTTTTTTDQCAEPEFDLPTALSFHISTDCFYLNVGSTEADYTIDCDPSVFWNVRVGPYLAKRVINANFVLTADNSGYWGSASLVFGQPYKGHVDVTRTEPLKFTVWHQEAEAYCMSYGSGIFSLCERREDYEVPLSGVCCSDVLAWDDAYSDDTIGASSTAAIGITDSASLGSYEWAVTGQGYTVTPTTAGVTNTLTSDATACGPATVTVNSSPTACEIEETIPFANATLEWDTANSDDTVSPGNSAQLVVTDSTDNSPYTWQVFGQGFTLDSTSGGLTNILYADATACGKTYIVVTNANCNTSATGVVYSTAGTWENSAGCWWYNGLFDASTGAPRSSPYSVVGSPPACLMSTVDGGGPGMLFTGVYVTASKWNPGTMSWDHIHCYDKPVDAGSINALKSTLDGLGVPRKTHLGTIIYMPCRSGKPPDFMASAVPNYPMELFGFEWTCV